MNGIQAADAVAAVMLLALTFYALLGGADYGGGVWDLFARGPRAERQRDLIAHAIGPVWEANHVWLIIVVVLLFTGFPAAFAAIMTALHVPLSLMLFGVVLRGSAFTFRSYDNTALGKRRWNRIFSIPSVVTPVLLGCIVGAIATGQVDPSPHDMAELFTIWLAPFPIAVGLFALAIFAYLAAVYLTLEAEDPDLREDFRRRAIAAAVVTGLLAYVVYFLARTEAPPVYRGLQTSRRGHVVHGLTALVATGALVSLGTRRFHVARVLAMLQVALILWGCALAQAPYLVPPRLTIANTAAPASIHRVLLATLGGGSLVLLPSLLYMFRVFKGHTLAPWPTGRDRTDR